MQEITSHWYFNSLRPRQNVRHFADNIFKCILLNKNVRISLKISLKFVPKARIKDIPASVQIMAWCQSGDKPFSEPVMVSLLTHICITQWVNTLGPEQRDWIFCKQHFTAFPWTEIFVFLWKSHWSLFPGRNPIKNKSDLAQIMAHCRTANKTFPEPMRPGSLAHTGLILGLHPANERRRYFVMTSLIGWAQA